MKKIFNKNNKGFTLVELIVVIAVLAIITVVVSPMLIEYVEKSRAGTDANAVGEVAHAAEVAYVDNDIKGPSNLLLQIDAEGNATYAGSLAEDTEEVLPPGNYIYKSKTYRGNTVTILVEDGVAKVEGLEGNTTGAGIIAGIINENSWFKVSEESVASTIDRIGSAIGIEDANQKLNQAILEIEASGKDFESMTKEERQAALNEQVDSLGDALAKAGVLGESTVCSCDPGCSNGWVTETYTITIRGKTYTRTRQVRCGCDVCH